MKSGNFKFDGGVGSFLGIDAKMENQSYAGRRASIKILWRRQCLVREMGNMVDFNHHNLWDLLLMGHSSDAEMAGGTYGL